MELGLGLGEDWPWRLLSLIERQMREPTRKERFHLRGKLDLLAGSILLTLSLLVARVMGLFGEAMSLLVLYWPGQFRCFTVSLNPQQKQ